MVLIYALLLQPLRVDKSKGAKSGVRNFFAPRNEIKQFQRSAKNCFYVKKAKLKRLADSGFELYNNESKAA